MPGTVLSALSISIYLVLIIILKGRYYYLPYFLEEETMAQPSNKTCPRSHNFLGVRPGSESRPSATRPQIMN